MENRLFASKKMLHENTTTCSTIDDYEVDTLSKVIKQTYQDHQLRPVIIEYNHRGRVKSNFAITHEYALWSIPIGKDLITRLSDISDEIRRNLRRTGTASKRHESPSQFYGIEVNKETLEIISVTDALPLGDPIPAHINESSIMVWPVDDEGVERRWYYGKDRILEEAKAGTVYPKKIKGQIQIHYFQAGKPKRRKSVWVGPDLDASTFGSELLNDIFGMRDFDFPKSIHAVQKCIESMSCNAGARFLDYFAGSGTTGHAVINLNRDDNGNRQYTLVEMGNHFNVVTKPRIQKVTYSSEWKAGKPVARDGISQIIKYIRLESYEDALNNLSFKEEAVAAGNEDFRRDYMLNYWLEFETQGSPSLLNVEAFADPTSYTLKVKQPGSDEYVSKNVDLVETFNWLIGLHVEHLDRWRGYNASTKREEDPELPEDSTTRLILDGHLEISAESDDGAWQFRKVEGYTLPTPGDKAIREKTLVIWRKLTGDMEADNLMLDEWFKKYCLSIQDTEFDVIYVNGSNNLPNLRQAEETWKVRLIEEHFHTRMWDMES